MLNWLLKLILTPIVLIAALALFAITVYQLDRMTPSVQWISQKVPAVAGPVMLVKTIGQPLSENGQLFLQDAKQTFLPDPETRMAQDNAKRRLKVVDASLKTRQAQLQTLQQQVDALEQEQLQLNRTAYPLKKWVQPPGSAR